MKFQNIEGLFFHSDQDRLPITAFKSFRRAAAWVVAASFLSNIAMAVAHVTVLEHRIQNVGKNLCEALLVGKIERYEREQPAEGVQRIQVEIRTLKELQENGSFANECLFAYAEGDATCGRWDAFYSIKRYRSVTLPDGRRDSESIPDEDMYRPSRGMAWLERYWFFGRNYSMEIFSDRGGAMLRFRVSTPLEGLAYLLFGWAQPWLHTELDSERDYIYDSDGCPDARRLARDFEQTLDRFRPR